MTVRMRLALLSVALLTFALVPSPAASWGPCEDNCALREYLCETGGYPLELCIAAYEICMSHCVLP